MSAIASRRWIKTADVAKLVRAALKAKFPGQKFSVRSDSYAGGSAVRVEWTDGPTWHEVEQILSQYAGSRFDGMIDLQYHAEHVLCPEHGPGVVRIYGHGAGLDREVPEGRCCEQAEPVTMGADYVQGQRRISPGYRAQLEAEIVAKYAVDPLSYEFDRLVHQAAEKTLR